MQILDIKTLRGPNHWSTYRKQLIEMKLDLGEMESRPSNKINGFADRLETLLPSLYEHRCSEDYPGGFFQRVREGTWMGHIVEHIALELQTLAGMDVGYGRTRSTGLPGVYHVVFAFEVEEAGLYAGREAVSLVEHLVHNRLYEIGNTVDTLRDIMLGNMEKNDAA
jgi:cyanophycin synthetase